MKKIKFFWKKILLIEEIYKKLDRMQRALGRIESTLQSSQAEDSIQQYEFQVYSQWGEDGIIQFLIKNIEVKSNIFVEFGVENYTESNTRFLLQNNNWSGLVIDADPQNIEKIKSDPIYWQYNLKAENHFINKNNINKILKKNGIEGEIGLLSIDIDGNDYWVWESIDNVKPAIVICEYNSLWGSRRKVTIPYDEKFLRSQAHFSGIYYGASIAALEALGNKKGYSLVGSNSAGNNLFFVRKDIIDKLPNYSPAQAYVKSNFRESRNIKGELNFKKFEKMLEQISEMPLYDIDLDDTILVKDLADFE